METTYTIQGYVVGDSWMPCNECYKPVKLEFVRNEADKRSPWDNTHETLRDALLDITNDGDFQSCQVAGGTLYITRTEYRIDSSDRITGRRIHQRVIELSGFPSIADMVKLDWNEPDGDEE